MRGGAKHGNGVPDAEVALLERELGAITVDTVPGVGHFIFEEAPHAVVGAVERLSATLRRTEDVPVGS